MKCTNTYCYWHYDGICCPDDEERYNKATPNELDCPSSLRKDFEESLYQLVDEISELLNRRSLKELIQWTGKHLADFQEKERMTK